MHPALLLVALVAPAPAMPDEVADLRRQIADLQHKVDALSAPASTPTTTEHGVKTPRGGFVIQGKPKKHASDDGEPAPAAQPKLQIKTLFYADFGRYTHTGFGPQLFDDGTRFPGPGNDGFDVFEITRAYLSFYFSPNASWTLRITPDVYRDVGTPAADKVGAISGFATNADQQPNFRLKYAFLDYNDVFRDDPHLKGAKLRFGQQYNPLVDWEEHLYGYRYTSLTPWNYVSLSSTQDGLALLGPIRFHAGEKPRAEYNIGVFDEAKFSQVEVSDEKQVMARLSFYPFGLTGIDEGLGFTFFGDWGASNTVPDLNATAGLYRDAFIAHYNTRAWSLAGEFDYGRNAFATGNLFSAVGPADQFGLQVTGFAATDALAKKLLDVTTSNQRGWSTFGHVRLGESQFDLFGLAQWFEPNIRVPSDPFDFRRTVAGVSYQPADFVRFAIDDQTFNFSHPPAQSLGNINVVFLNMEFFY